MGCNSGRNVHDRLGVELETTIGQRVTYPRPPTGASDRVLALPVTLGRDHYSVPSVLLRFVHGEISAGQRVVRSRIAPAEEGAAHGDGRRNDVVVDLDPEGPHGFCDGVSHRLGG